MEAYHKWQIFCFQHFEPPQNDRKCSKIADNNRKWAKMTKIVPKTAKNDRKSMKMTEGEPKTGENRVRGFPVLRLA